ncbi:Lin1244/Lin1753 domain-containing protein [Heyndrickxia sporothermodurans]
MARPKKEGLDYFPLDVDIDQNDKIALIEAKHGVVGFSVVIKLFMKIYKAGYFYKWTEREHLLFSRRVNVDINTVSDVVNDCIEWELFDKNLFNDHKILTSEGIQKRYLDAVSRRKEVVFQKEYLLIDPLDFIGNSKISVFIVNADGNKVNVNINSTRKDNCKHQDGSNPQSKVKESKVKESKVKDIKKEDEKGRSENPFMFYEKNGFGTIGSHISEKIIQWCEDLSDELVLEAMKTSVEHSVKNWAYVESILKGWAEKKITTVEQAYALQQQHKENRSKQLNQRNGKAIRTEIIPEYIQQSNNSNHADNVSMNSEADQNKITHLKTLQERYRQTN